MKSDIHNNETTGDDRYPNTWQNNLHIFTRYTNPTIPINISSQGNSFFHKTGDGRNPKTYDKAYWKYK